MPVIRRDRFVGGTIAHRYFLVLLAAGFLLAVPSILFVYRTVERVLREEIHGGALDQLDRISSVVTMMHSSTIPATIQLFEQKEVQRLMFGNDNSGETLLRRLDLLQQARLSNPIVDSIVVYNYRNRMVYSSESGPIPAEQFHDTQLLEIIGNIRRYGAYRYIPRTRGDENYFTVIIGYYPIEGEGLRGAVSIDIRESLIREFFVAPRDGLSGEVIVLDSDGTVLSHPSPEGFGTTFDWTDEFGEVPLISDGEGTFEALYAGEPSLVTFMNHPVVGWRFIRIVPARDVFFTVHQTRNRTLLIVFAVVFAGIVVNRLLSQVLARPVRRLSQHAQRMYQLLPAVSAIDAPPETEQEVAFVDRTLDLIRERLQTLDTYYRSHHRRHREELVLRLVTGRACEPEIDWAAEDVESLRPHNRVYVAAVELGRSERDGQFRRRHVLTECPTSFTRLIVPIDDAHIAILCGLPRGKPQTGDTALDELHMELRVALERMNSIESRVSIGFSVGAAAGPPETGAGSLREMYGQALRAARQRFRADSQNLFSFGGPQLFASSTHQLPEQSVERLIKEARAQHEDRVRSILDEMIQDVRRHRYEDFVFFGRYLIYEMNRHLSTPEISNDTESIEIARLTASTDWLWDIETLREAIEEILIRYCRREDSGGFSRRSEIVQRIIEITSQHYADANLSPKAIGDRLSLSTNYVRRVFKEETGESIGEHINRLRLAECKTVLVAEDISIKELYARVGFASYNYFFEAFKKDTGLTPAQFRRSFAPQI